MARFFGIGLGPGEPGLVTLKAYRLLQQVDAIFVPRAEGSKEGTAEKILRALGIDEQRFVRLSFPMMTNREPLKEGYRRSAARVLELLGQGKDVAYVTLGDPLLYSTYIYLLEALGELSGALSIETVPGVTSYSAMASRFNYSLAESTERLLIYPASADMDDLERAILSSDTTVIMKAGRWLPQIMAVLERLGLKSRAIFASRLGLEGERLVDMRQTSPSDKDMPEGYLSTIIVRRRR